MPVGRMSRPGWGLGPVGPVGEEGWEKPPPCRGFVVGLLSGLFSITVWSWPSALYEPLAGITVMMSVFVRVI